MDPARATSAPASEETFGYAPGDLIGDRYLLVRTLDHGGMGVVWVAHHLGLDVHVALKLLQPEAQSPAAAERLVQEAQAAARVDHPGIVRVLDVGRTSEGHPFLVMELLEGESLEDILFRKTRLDPVTAIQLVLPVADALDALHAKGIIHRDVKPGNIFVSVDDAGRWQPKLIDFGLARLTEQTRRHRITERGAIIGTPMYLSPERVRGQDARPSDDVWALCVVLYEMASGALPFPGDTMLEIFTAIAGRAPVPLASHGVNDPELWEILRRGLTTSRERWSSMRDLRNALARELLRRGTTKDISGLTLHSTARFHAPPAVGLDAPATPLGHPVGAEPLTVHEPRPADVEASMIRRIARAPAAEPAPDDAWSPPAAAARHPGARLTPVIALGLVMLGVVLGLIAGVLIGRQSTGRTPIGLSVDARVLGRT